MDVASAPSAVLKDGARAQLFEEDPTGLTSELIQLSHGMPWGLAHGGGTGEIIAICNGANEGHCTEAADVVKHRLRRPGKMAAPGDPDYVDDSKKEPTAQAVLKSAGLEQGKPSKEPLSE